MGNQKKLYLSRRNVLTYGVYGFVAFNLGVMLGNKDDMLKVQSNNNSLTHNINKPTDISSKYTLIISSRNIDVMSYRNIDNICQVYVYDSTLNQQFELRKLLNFVHDLLPSSLSQEDVSIKSISALYSYKYLKNLYNKCITDINIELEEDKIMSSIEMISMYNKEFYLNKDINNINKGHKPIGNIIII